MLHIIILEQQIQMSSQKLTLELGQPEDYSTPAPLSAIYQQIMKNFDKHMVRLKQKLTNPLFDDTPLMKHRKTLPKINQEIEKKNRKKFYSNKLIANQAVFIHERKQCEPEQITRQNRQFQTMFSPLRQKCVLSDRNKRIMELYRRAEKDHEFSPIKIKFNKQVKRMSVQHHDQSPSTKKLSLGRPSSKKMLDILKIAQQRRKALQPLFMRPQRSKSNILINSYSQQNPQKVQGKKIEGTPSNAQNIRIKTVKNMTQSPQREKSITKRFNWRNEPFPINKINEDQFYKLIRYYLKVSGPTPIQSGFYKAYIGSGNNGALIKKLLKDRGHWTIVQSLDEEPNFVWTQLKSQSFLSSLKQCPIKQYQSMNRKLIQNPFPQLSSFLRLKQNEYTQGCQKIFEYKHYLTLVNNLRSRFQTGNSVHYYARLKQVYVDYLEENVLKPNKDKQNDKSNNKDKEQIKAVDIKLHNHMDGAGVIGEKKGLLYMMEHYCTMFEQNINDFIPVTVHLTNPQYYNQAFTKIPEGPWIHKPGQATNRGQGITVHTTKQTLIQELTKKKKHKNGVKFTSIIQQYIDPLLYHGRKFDIRVWVLWTGRRLWWYKQGYLRTSSKQFSYKNMNKFIHLTNDAIQSQSDDFGKHQPANKLSFNEIDKYLQSQHNFSGFYSQILPQMQATAIKAFRMGNILFDKHNKQFTFELFGLDFLIDSKFKPWLIECNTNPCIEINCSLLARLVPNMLNNVLNLTVDSYFPIQIKKKKAQSPAWNHETFKFQLIYNGEYDVQMEQKLLKSKTTISYNEQQQDDEIMRECAKTQ